MDCYLYIGGRRVKVKASLEGVNEAFKEDPLKPLWLVRGYVEGKLGRVKGARFLGVSFRDGVFRLRYLVEAERRAATVEIAYILAKGRVRA
ncbi:MAG: hypothetical protein DRJ97_02045 [Thermoprotei archaeon]|nr:MAG: hypothetical protein DRJ97_02045 [Thermoprotei archaeon]